MPERIVDLRSDTVTRPTDAMREAMARAPVGDDEYGEDPTVNQLEELAAAKLGMEAALYVPSGSMGNRCALIAHTGAGQGVYYETGAHIFAKARRGHAEAAGLRAYPLDGAFGVIAPGQLQEAVDAAGLEAVRGGLVCIENSHNLSGGNAWAPSEVEALAAAARARNLKLHMDGARLFNAAVARGVEASEFTRHADSVMFCVSKGLSAPVGSLLCGSHAFIDRARDVRKDLGGTMRQAGIIAAAGIVALDTMVPRLAEDQANAKRLYEGLSCLPRIIAEQPPAPTNFVTLDGRELGWHSSELLARLKEGGVLANPRPPTRARLVLHRHIGLDDLDHVVEVVRGLVGAG